jgi:DNA primase large subunit
MDAPCMQNSLKKIKNGSQIIIVEIFLLMLFIIHIGYNLLGLRPSFVQKKKSLLYIHKQHGNLSYSYAKYHLITEKENTKKWLTNKIFSWQS